MKGDKLGAILNPYFYELCRPIEPKKATQRKCMRCKKHFKGFESVCSTCRRVVKRASVMASSF